MIIKFFQNGFEISKLELYELLVEHIKECLTENENYSYMFSKREWEELVKNFLIADIKAIKDGDIVTYNGVDYYADIEPFYQENYTR